MPKRRGGEAGGEEAVPPRAKPSHMPFPPFALERWFAQYEFCTEHLLCTSDCESMRVGDLLALEPGTHLDDVWLGYTESVGSPPLREAIATLYDGFEPDDILVHVGAQEAIHNFSVGLFQPGDHVVVHQPAYQSLHAVAEAIGCEVTPWIAREADDWTLDPAHLPRLLRPNTRAVIVNTPHNPTGAVIDGKSLSAIAATCEARGVVLFCDEVYRFSERQAADRAPAACELSPSAVSLGVLSKSFGLAGLRIGWIATRNRAVHARMREMKDYTTICAPSPSEHLAVLALRHRQEILSRTRAIIDRNLALANAFFERHTDRFTWVPPRAGPIAFPRFRDGCDARDFCERLVRVHGVLLLPGAVYGAAWHAHFRIGLGRVGFPEGLTRLEQALAVL